MGHHSAHSEHESHVHRDQPSYLGHKTHGALSLACMVVTCSDTRTRESDTSGKLICHLLKEHGHSIANYQLIKDEPTTITRLLTDAAKQVSTEAIIINGGTGISRRDSTFEAVDGFLQKRLDGFGELFRYLSYKEIGSAAMLSRATAGIHEHLAIFSIPGSQGAVRLAMEQLILPEIGHIAGELTK